MPTEQTILLSKTDHFLSQILYFFLLPGKKARIKSRLRFLLATLKFQEHLFDGAI